MKRRKATRIREGRWKLGYQTEDKRKVEEIFMKQTEVEIYT